jgi:hypothetical protein
MFENPGGIYYKFYSNYMVAKTMSEQKICEDCKQKHDCRRIYEQLGGVEGPSVLVKVIVAFLLPLVVFIVSLAAFQEIFAKAISSQRVQTAFSFLLALVVTFICILIVRVVNRTRTNTDLANKD